MPPARGCGTPARAPRGVVVGVVEAHLRAPAEHEDGSAEDDEGPERRDLVVAEVARPVEGADRGEGALGGGAVVVQHGGDGDGDLAHPPRRAHVAEVDDGVGHCRAGGAQDVVVGDVEVPGLQREGVGDGREGGPGRVGGALHGAAHLGVRIEGEQGVDHARGVAEVPLQHAAARGVREVGEREAHRTGKGAESLHDRGREVARAVSVRPAMFSITRAWMRPWLESHQVDIGP